MSPVSTSVCQTCNSDFLAGETLVTIRHTVLAQFPVANEASIVEPLYRAKLARKGRAASCIGVVHTAKGCRLCIKWWNTVSMEDLQYSDSITISRSADELYDMISDVTRMGEWSPVCKECWWEESDTPRTGAWFIGRNVTPDRTWETRSQVVAAEPGREFSFVVGGTWTRWGYTFYESEAGTVVTESWEFLPGGIERFEERFGDDAPNQIADRQKSAREGIPETLAALKRVAESQ